MILTHIAMESDYITIQSISGYYSGAKLNGEDVAYLAALSSYFYKIVMCTAMWRNHYDIARHFHFYIDN